VTDEAVDPVVLDSLRRLGERSGRDVFGELSRLFLTTAAAHVATAVQLLAADDFDELAKVAHGLKGSSSVIGGRRVAAAASALEAAALGRGSRTAECARTALDQVLREMEVFRRAALTLTPHPHPERRSP
jgi:HPt (histidine-containing phosphotransfer) domain-containing protein